MKKDLTKLAMLGLLAGSCISATDMSGGSEIAMSKCTRESDTSGKSSCSSCDGKSGCPGKDMNETDESCSEQTEESLKMKKKREETAQQTS
jgi:hypothetical protein